MNILSHITAQKNIGRKLLAFLIDPDKSDPEQLNKLSSYEPDLWLVGGSYLHKGDTASTISIIKGISNVPVILFPGSSAQIDPMADALLLLSLVSGRNPDYLIGKHVEASMHFKESKLEIIPTAYMLVDGGSQTSAHYISNTRPLPSDKPELAAATALAAEQLGMRLNYLDSGSGAKQQVSRQLIKAVQQISNNPLLVGGGIRNSLQAQIAWEHGADVVVVGNALEENAELGDSLNMTRNALNTSIQA